MNTLCFEFATITTLASLVLLRLSPDYWVTFFCFDLEYHVMTCVAGKYRLLLGHSRFGEEQSHSPVTGRFRLD